MVILNSLQSVLSIILMLSIGYFFSHKGWFNNETSKLFSKVVINIAVPCYMVSNLLTTYTKDKLIQFASGVFVPFASIIICYILGIILAKIFNIPSNKRGIFVSTLSIANTLFVGLPVNTSLFGNKSLPFVFIYFLGNISLFWTIGAFCLAKDGGDKKVHLFSSENLKNLFSPPLCGFIAAIILILLQITLPKCVMDTCKYMGNLVTPLSMLYIGIIIYNIDIKEIKWDKSLTLITIGRFIVSPLIVFLMCSFLHLPILMEKVFIIQSGMPAMSITSVLSEASGGDYKYAAVVTTMTTLATLIFIPIYIVLLSNL
ncbi:MULTISPECIES: AEC family transporter [Clostridium]|uniref:AEC family transporter n=1 Tax=Clostridium TaxID=1485 RepID=UPI000825A5DB|nr:MULTISPECIES: AEC family transporter [Clostridium]PJI07252.1 AEC family transporter [Clostridium sp. CT7]